MPNSNFDISFDEKRIDALFASLNHSHLPGAAVGIAIRGRPVYRKGFGVASMELPLALSPSIRMPIGSITKHFTCLAYLLQCERGKASLDDTIGKYCPEFQRVTQAVTIRQLMGHLAGIRDTYEITLQFSGLREETSGAEMLELYRTIDDLNAPIGKLMSYNNSGYLILSAIIERIAGRSLEEVFREEIFRPIGMSDTFLRRFDSKFVPNCASLHLGNPADGYVKGKRQVEGIGQGGIWSTIDDMLRWLAHMDAPSIGRASTWRDMKTPLTLSNGQSTGYGLGLLLNRYRGIGTVQHAGGVFGGNSQMIKVPDVGLDVVILVNRSDVMSIPLAYQVIDACVTNLDPIEKGTAHPIVTGVFRSPRSGRVMQWFGRGTQQIVSVEGTDTAVMADIEGVYRPLPLGPSGGPRWTLLPDSESPSAVRYEFFGSSDVLTVLAPETHADLNEIAGHYRSDSTNTAATILSDGRLHFESRSGAMDYRLESLARGIWRARSTGPMLLGGVLTFERDSTRFRFSNGRTVGLQFERRR